MVMGVQVIVDSGQLVLRLPEVTLLAASQAPVTQTQSTTDSCT